jgi:ectoine hydroxylase-related dioxygenase (phytanoyl-CoA dioxygenase family)
MKLSHEELSKLTLDPETLKLAIQKVQMDGFVLFEGVIPREQIDTVREAFLKTITDHMNRTPSNRGTNRYQMHVPFEEPFITPMIIENPLAMSILDALLGDNCHCHYFASDTAFPGSDYQAVHSDIHLLFPETQLSLPPYSIVVNIPLIDVTLEHGPVEIWPGGTHLMPGNLDMKMLAPTMHSELVTMPAGSVLVRDMRMWHRGTPNRSSEIRPHLALVYSRFWYRESSYTHISIPQSTYTNLSDRARRLFRFEKIT